MLELFLKLCVSDSTQFVPPLGQYLVFLPVFGLFFAFFVPILTLVFKPFMASFEIVLRFFGSFSSFCCLIRACCSHIVNLVFLFVLIQVPAFLILGPFPTSASPLVSPLLERGQMQANIANETSEKAAKNKPGRG